jgi:hypothetical protein
LVQEFVVAEFSRLERQGVFSFAGGDGSALEAVDPVSGSPR